MLPGLRDVLATYKATADRGDPDDLVFPTLTGSRRDPDNLRERVLAAVLGRADDAVADKVDELLFAHVVEGRYHPSVVVETLPGLLGEVIGAARSEDWQAITDELIAEARDADGEV